MSDEQKKLSLSELDKAIELDPQNPQNHYHRSILHNFQGNRDKALEDINKAIKLDPQNSQNYSHRSILQDDLDNALEDINKAIKLDPQHHRHRLIRGLTHVFQGNYEDASEDYIQANKLDSKAKLLVAELFIASEMEDDLKGLGLLLKLSIQTEFLMRQIHEYRSPQYESPEKEVFHYTSDKALKSIVEEGFRFYDVKYLNDILEGNVFFDLLEIENEDKKKIKTLLFSSNSSFEHSIFIGSFTISKDDDGAISMWRIYGNGEKRSRAAGGSMLCWKRKIFSEELPGTKLHFLHKSQFASEYSRGNFFLDNSNGQHIEKDQLLLLPVIYADVPEDLNLNDLGKVASWHGNIGKTLEAVLDHHDSRKEDDPKNKKLIALTRLILDKIRFLFKSKQYIYESEERIVVVRSLQTVEVETTKDQNVPGRFHIKTNPEYFTPHKVVLGPTNTEVDEWDKYLNKNRERNKAIQVKKSAIKFKESA